MSAFDDAPAASGSGRFLIVGLGNLGPGYARNRHNVGFQVLDRLAGDLGVRFRRERRLGHIAVAQMVGEEVVLQKPLTFMNLSGEAVAPAVRRFGVEPLQRLLVVHDDLDLPLGKIRLRPRGGAGGHNGLRSIIDQLLTQDFPRLRIGIGRSSTMEPHDFVLSDFTPEEEPVIEKAREQAVLAIHAFVRDGIIAAMNQFNGEPEAAQEP
jgi:PTH1 family peptidyl-tRNA hydrolase